MTNLEKKFIACMVLHGLGDAIGYNNSKWEFKVFKTQRVSDAILAKISEYFYYGGVKHVPQKDWVVSDDTVMHIKVAKSLLQNFNNLDQFCKIIKKHFIDALNQFDKEGLNLRHPGNNLISYINKLRDGLKWNKVPYDYHAGGSGASMRSSCIGLAYSGKKNRYKLIQMSIESSRITHNSAVGYLGGLTSALFTAYALENINIKLWPTKLMKLFTDGHILKYIKSAGRDIKNFNDDHSIFLEKWNRYLENKFDENGNIIRKRADKNLVYRIENYYNLYGFSEDKQKHIFFPGSGGDDSVIIAYDCLLDAGDNWEKLVGYAMLNAGDADTIGCIASSWYGVLYGFDDVPESSLKNLEMKDELEILGKQLFKKYSK